MFIRQLIQVQKSLPFSWTSAKPLTLSTYIFYKNKLEHYDIRGFVNKWLRSFLENLSKFVSIEAEKSDTIRSNIGVFQGYT